MARQNVGNPKFYIDLLSYWKAKGNIKASGFPIDGDLTAHYVGGATYHANLIGLNPTDHVQEDFEYDASEVLGVGFDSSIEVQQDSEFFFGFLGHNFKEVKNRNVELELVNDDNDEVSVDYDEIVNLTQDSEIAKDGWSLAKLKENLNDNIISHINFIIENEEAYDNGYLTPLNTSIGSLAFGHIFQMPFSPDLSLTMSRSYEGVSKQQTIGGSTLTQVNYSKPAEWLGYPAWDLYEASLLTSSELITKYSSRGRRAWELSYSYIDGDNIFSINENTSNDHESGIGSNTASGYTSDDFDSNGKFNYNIHTGTGSFLGSVMEKTMGGALPFIFQPDGNNDAPDQFAICTIDQNSFNVTQVANSVYSVRMVITESW